MTIRDPDSGRRISVRTESGLAIDKINFLKDQPIAIASTTEHLIVIEINRELVSEVRTVFDLNPSIHPHLSCLTYGVSLYLIV